MDSDEEEGLRAFQLEVGCDGGAPHPGQPVWVEREGARTGVASVLARWGEEERLGFRVCLTDGNEILLYYVPDLDIWSCVWPTAGPAPIVRRRQRT